MRWEAGPEVGARPEELLRRFSARVQQLAERARAAVLSAVPDAVEEVRPNRGYLGYRLKYQFAFVEPLQDCVRLGFARGALLADPGRLLHVEPARTVGYLRLDRPADARRAELAALLQAAAGLLPPRRPARGRAELKRAERPVRRHAPSTSR